jgi:four helix bundle protein
VKNDLTQRCYDFSLKFIGFISVLPNTGASRVISDQLLRSGTSIGANVVEAKSASSRRDFTRYYEIALKSANETKYWLGLARDGLKVNGAETDFLMSETNELAKIIASSILTLKDKRTL